MANFWSLHKPCFISNPEKDERVWAHEFTPGLSGLAAHNLSFNDLILFQLTLSYLHWLIIGADADAACTVSFDIKIDDWIRELTSTIKCLVPDGI